MDINSGKILIELKEISKTFGKVKAVDKVSLSVYSNDRLVILGSSGCGKTTILRLIAGLESPDSGELIINGEIASSKDRFISPNGRNLGMVFQDLALWPHMTVKENLNFVLYPRFSKIERKEKIEKILKLTSLDKLINCYPSGLSGGQKQRVAVARAIVSEPKILLMDEPLASLDIFLKEELEKLILDLQERLKVTLLYVTHNQDEAMAMAKNVAIMNEGKLIEAGSKEVIFNNPKSEFARRFSKK